MEALVKDFVTKGGLNLPGRAIESVLELHKEGATVPFIARYRKERTGNLDEVEIRRIIDGFNDFNELNKRRDFIVQEIEKQGNLTPELKQRIAVTNNLGDLEELYRPYKRKKKTKATLGKEAGLQPLADWLWKLAHGELNDPMTLEVKAKEFTNAEKGFVTYQEVLRGAQHIITEKIANDVALRKVVRDEFFENAQITSQATTHFKKNSKYEMYKEYKEPVRNLSQSKATHRYLAIRRGWQEEELKVNFLVNEEKLKKAFLQFASTKPTAQSHDLMAEAAEQALTVHVVPSVTNELHRQLKDLADEDAINVFSQNLRKVLMASPFGAKLVLGVDPGIRTGCKLALVDKSGQYISSTVLHLGTDAADLEKAKKLFEDVLRQVKIEAVAIGNGTGGREAEAFLRKLFKELNSEVPVIMVSESGASVYSASEVAREEFPELDITVRGAISIARRLQDPLSELVKVDPKSIGVGQYQHDVSQTSLMKSLEGVVESCVNSVGVELNTGSESLLQFVSGIGPGIAKKIEHHRQKVGLFKERSDLLKVDGFSSKTFELAAGFLRIQDGIVALDRTGIHPERYSAVKEMAKELGVSVKALMEGEFKKLKEHKDKWATLVGEFTFNDILLEFEKPGRDPRDPFKVFTYREDIHELKDLQKGMICPGLVTNVTNFGAFVDIGVHQDGLVHISELSHNFVSDPRTVVSPGDQVKVRVLEFDVEKSQISLSMKLEERKQVQAPRSDLRASKERGSSRKRDDHRQGGKPKGRGGHGPGKPGQGKPREERKPKNPFNNPFAALTNLKNSGGS